ncbi:MAG TPA: phytanoyl-CoA dioxygenase family protein [Verrucomicrobiae bacterium]|nr:phytanoyl-CoA dioxygenase family protein [Verrucomicrobiae bacterium]
MEIDLSFQPVATAQPRHLTQGQISFYNENGYLKPFTVYDPPHAERNRAYFDYLLAELRARNDGRDSYAINGYHGRCKGIYEMATHPAILDLVEDIVGPNIIAWATHFFCKLPGDPKHVHWHQDASYWPLTPARTVTAWLAIDDANIENACMHFLPGTHRRGQLEYRRPDTPGVLWQEITDIERYGNPVADELKAGQISLHADMLAHGSAPNLSGRRRCGLTIRYCPPEVQPIGPGWGGNAILCRGRCDNARWNFPAKPLGEDLSGSRPKAIGGN